jgi:hypothetical protein
VGRPSRRPSLRAFGLRTRLFSSWFRGTQTRHEARIRAGGVEKDVRLVETDALGDEIDAAYRAKYQRYAESIVGSTVTSQARAATLELVPR